MENNYEQLVKALQAAEPTEKQVVDYCNKRCLVVLGADLFHEMKASYGKMPKRGEWIDRYDEDDKPFFKRKYVCSACGHWNTYGKSKYCPNCGAKMMEVQDDKA